MPHNKLQQTQHVHTINIQINPLIISTIGIVHVVKIRVGNLIYYLQVGHLHLLGMPVTGSLKLVTDWHPRINQYRLIDYRQIRAASAAS